MLLYNILNCGDIFETTGHRTSSQFSQLIDILILQALMPRMALCINTWYRVAELYLRPFQKFLEILF